MLQGLFQQQFKRHKPFSDKIKAPFSECFKKHYLTHRWEINRITLTFLCGFTFHVSLIPLSELI
nr:MAG TPA: hypothetical protein [Caudoviricetes sp.]